jgi:hypothetical protein
VNRRGFLRGLLTAVAVVAIEVKLAREVKLVHDPEPAQYGMRWEHANDRYKYGIDPRDPLLVGIFDKTEKQLISADELMRRGIDQSSRDAYEAVAIIAMSQGRLLHKRGEPRMVMAPEFVSTLDEDHEIEDDRAYILAAVVGIGLPETPV